MYLWAQFHKIKISGYVKTRNWKENTCSHQLYVGYFNF